VIGQSELKQEEVREGRMNSERDGINPAAMPSGTGCVECSGLDGCGGCIFADAPNAVTLAAATVHQSACIET
jgi:hypothetical protein